MIRIDSFCNLGISSMIPSVIKSFGSMKLMKSCLNFCIVGSQSILLIIFSIPKNPTLVVTEGGVMNAQVYSFFVFFSLVLQSISGCG